MNKYIGSSTIQCMIYMWYRYRLQATEPTLGMQYIYKLQVAEPTLGMQETKKE